MGWFLLVSSLVLLTIIAFDWFGSRKQQDFISRCFSALTDVSICLFKTAAALLYIMAVVALFFLTVLLWGVYPGAATILSFILAMLVLFVPASAMCIVEQIKVLLKPIVGFWQTRCALAEQKRIADFRARIEGRKSTKNSAFMNQIHSLLFKSLIIGFFIAIISLLLVDASNTGAPLEEIAVAVTILTTMSVLAIKDVFYLKQNSKRR